MPSFGTGIYNKDSQEELTRKKLGRDALGGGILGDAFGKEQPEAEMGVVEMGRNPNEQWGSQRGGQG